MVRCGRFASLALQGRGPKPITAAPAPACRRSARDTLRAQQTPPASTGRAAPPSWPDAAPTPRPGIDGDMGAIGIAVTTEQQQVERLETGYGFRPLAIFPKIARPKWGQLKAEMGEHGIGIALAIRALRQVMAGIGDLRSIVRYRAKPRWELRQQIAHHYLACVPLSLGCIMRSETQTNITPSKAKPEATK